MKRLVTQKKKKNVEAGKPGFTEEQLTALKAQVLAGKEKGRKVVCSLMLDEMSIRKHARYDGTKVLGYVDLGAGITDNSPPVATKALDVYMAVSVNSNWKTP